ncbi:MAG: 2-amino-4-hydroxy-6-hydroxymethyldihydropteridine diphosphokinase [Phycisphaerales bacterium]|nr:2-amino-4-hydroxy-6-hydroxymethyldihydropteridine diphosphokinase [Phycisphaerales bacterium]
MKVTGFIGLGSNLGDRVASILQAVEALDETPGVMVFRLSTLLETEPVGLQEQGDFLNAVVEVRSTLSASQVLQQMLAIESGLGRDRASSTAGGPREIDLDLLLWGEEISETPGVQVPHPRLHERAFVLVPMVELAPDLVHPTIGRSMRDLLEDEIKVNGPLPDRCRPAGRGPLLDS